jgi:chromosomal replication initiator protein
VVEERQQLCLGEEENTAKLRRAFDGALRHLTTQIDRPTFRVLFPTVKPVRYVDGKVVLGVANEFDKTWLSSRYSHMIASAIGSQLGEKVELEFILVRPEEGTLVPQDPLMASPSPTYSRRETLELLPRPEFVDRYAFESFIVGPSNRLAHAGASAVSENPGFKFNPLFIFGGVGLGKTHLLHAIGQQVLTNCPNMRVAYMSGEAFADQYVSAVREQRIEHFRRRLRSVELWLIDDVQFIAGKERTQEEFFHTFNALYQTGRQIVLCSDRPPKELYLMEERLRSRFEQGLVADIAAPDLETRAAILLKKAEAENFEIPMDVVYYVADKIQSNIRSLEGALTRLMTQASLTNQPVTTQLAAKVLGAFFIEPTPYRPAITVKAIIKACCKQFGLSADEMTGQGRKSNIAQARQVAMYLAREHTQLSWKAIGKHLGNRDHTTVMHGHRLIAQSLLDIPAMESAVQEILSVIRSPQSSDED